MAASILEAATTTTCRIFAAAMTNATTTAAGAAEDLCPVSPTAAAALELAVAIGREIRGMILPVLAVLVGIFVLAYAVLMLLLVNTDHTFLSILKMNVSSCYRVVGGGNPSSPPPVAPFGIFECVHKMTSDQQPWFPLEAKKALGNTDTFVLPLPRRPVMTGDYALAREILTDPLSKKPRTYLEFEPLGIGSIFTRNGSFWVSTKKRQQSATSNSNNNNNNDNNTRRIIENETE